MKENMRLTQYETRNRINLGRTIISIVWAGFLCGIGITSPVRSDVSVQMTASTDDDGDGLQDSFQDWMEEKGATCPDRLRVVVTLGHPPGEMDIQAFEAYGGKLTQGPWRHALYGFAGTMPSETVQAYARSGRIRELINDNVPVKQLLYQSARQIGARSQVWNAYGYTGDPQTTIAVLDTGCDVTHAAFSPGYLGEGNFAGKIVSWQDFSSSGNDEPYDSDGHGTHTAGIAAGGGFAGVQSSGRVSGTDTFKTKLAGEYPQWGQIIITEPGVVSVNLLFDETDCGYFSNLYLRYGNSHATYNGLVNGWTTVAHLANPVVSVDLGQSDEILHWNTLNYTVQPGQEGLYHIVTDRVIDAGSCGMFGSVKFEIYSEWDAGSDDDGYMEDGWPVFTGIAPTSKLAIYRSQYPSDWDNAINYCVANRSTLHVTVISMSQGSTTNDSAVENAVNNASNSGIVFVAAAGNDGSGDENMSFPAKNSQAIGVAAVDQSDFVTSYSSQGGVVSGHMKPDICAPGGSTLAAGGIWSTDSNDGNISLAWGIDRAADDATSPQGTSQATPMIAGAAQLVIDALGGWSYMSAGSAEKTRKVKQLLFMTATETNLPRWGASGVSVDSPTLSRGAGSYSGKDAHEGYGRINVNAAVEAAVFSMNPAGDTVTEYLAASRNGFNPSSGELDVVNATQRHAFARKIALISGQTYPFSLDVPDGADLDLHLYMPDPDQYGNPAPAASSILSEPGADESINYTASNTGTYYLVVKAISGQGHGILRAGSGGSVSPTPTQAITPTRTPTTPGTAAPTSTPTRTPTGHYSQTPTQSPTRTPTQMSTATPTQTAIPTSTPTVQPGSPTNTAHPAPTNTPIPTFTPVEPTSTASPTVIPPSATPTNPSGGFSADLLLTDTVFEAGEVFVLTLEIMNQTQANLHLHQYLLLDVYGDFYFHPEWGQDPIFTDCMFADGYQDYIEIIRFVWPIVNGNASGLRFYLGYLDAESQELIGDIDTVEFGYR